MEVEVSKSVRRCGAKHILKSKVQKTEGRSTFGRSDVGLRGRRRGLRTFSKVSKMWVLRHFQKRFEEDLERYIFCRRRSTRDMFIRDVRR